MASHASTHATHLYDRRATVVSPLSKLITNAYDAWPSSAALFCRVYPPRRPLDFVLLVARSFKSDCRGLPCPLFPRHGRRRGSDLRVCAARRASLWEVFSVISIRK